MLSITPAQAAGSVRALRALGVQGMDSRGDLAHRMPRVRTSCPQGHSLAGGSWISGIRVSFCAWARNAGGPLFDDPPCVQYSKRTSEPPASRTSRTILFASVATAICAAARQISRCLALRLVFSRSEHKSYYQFYCKNPSVKGKTRDAYIRAVPSHADGRKASLPT
jgi:hypothetical protein